MSTELLYTLPTDVWVWVWHIFVLNLCSQLYSSGHEGVCLWRVSKLTCFLFPAKPEEE